MLPSMPEIDDVDKAVRRDVTLLIELHSLLPPLENEDERGWWEQYSAAHHKHRQPGAPPLPDGAYYMVTKLSQHLEEAFEYARDFASYCLYFFDDPSPEMIALVGQQLDLPGSGARLLGAICEVAWRVFVPLELAAKRDV